MMGASPADPTVAGLVRLDREGQVIPAVALRWAILEDGRDYLFRVDQGAGLPAAATIARRLGAAIRARPRGRPASGIGGVESVRAVTPTVLEIRLARPQPNLLALLALPELAVAGPGPFRGEPAADGTVLLRPRSADGHASAVRLRAEPAGRAVARFVRGGSSLVTGGTFADLAVAQAAASDNAALRFDPATGLFGLALRDRAGRYGDPRLVRALALAVDRDRLGQAIGAPWPAATDDAAPLAARVAAARALVAEAGAPPSALRIALPPGPGARLLLALLRQDWARLGIATAGVPLGAPADFTLIDRVAPPGSLAALACAVSAGCDPDAAVPPPFVPLGAPVRWSLVAPALDRFSPNPLAAHPLDQLRTAR